MACCRSRSGSPEPIMDWVYLPRLSECRPSSPEPFLSWVDTKESSSTSYDQISQWHAPPDLRVAGWLDKEKSSFSLSGHIPPSQASPELRVGDSANRGMQDQTSTADMQPLLQLQAPMHSHGDMNFERAKMTGVCTGVPVMTPATDRSYNSPTEVLVGACCRASRCRLAGQAERAWRRPGQACDTRSTATTER